MVLTIRHTKYIVKLLVMLVITIVILTYQNHFANKRRLSKFQIWRKTLENDKMKYILIWSKEEPDLDVLKNEQEAFIQNKCLYNNCYVTKQRNFTNIVYTNFDAIVISGRNLSNELPEKRYSDQTFIFASKESADNYPVCSYNFDNYFNLTWTYKLNSDIVWRYFVLLDKTGKQVAPSSNITWVTHVKKLSKKMGNDILRVKKHAVAWFASNCFTRSKRESFILKLKHALEFYRLEVHVVGTCGTLKCPLENDKDCMKILGQYYFYLAFENSLAEDYVSEKVLKPLLHYAVPVVFGGANYSRFLPPNSYINARELGPKKTAAKIASLIVNHTAYLEYFNWHNHYTFNVTDASVCSLCEWLNKGVKRVHSRFKQWWNPVNETCRSRNRRSTIRSRILGELLGSTCSLDEAPYLVSFYKNSGVYTMNRAFMARNPKEKPGRRG